MLVSRRLGSDPQLKKASANNPPLIRNATGTGVALVQDLLADLGFPLPRSLKNGPSDGILGPETEAAIKAFQATWSLKQDGIIGTDTLDALESEILMDGRLELKDGRTDPSLGYW